MDKKAAKRSYLKIASPEERGEITALEVMEMNDRFDSVAESLDILEKALAKVINSFKDTSKGADIAKLAVILSKGFAGIRAAHGDQMENMADSIKDMQTSFIKNLGVLKGTLETGQKANDFNKNAGPMYKTMINHLAGMEQSFANWKYPQYASVSVRNKSFSNIDPAINDVATSAITGLGTVTTAGTPVQLANLACVAVYIQAHESNTNPITVGDSHVVGALSGRRGYTLYPTNTQKFTVSNTNLLYVDAVSNGDKFHYYVEIA